MKTEEWGEIAARFHLVPDGEGGWLMDFPVGTRRENFNKICERLITGEIAAAGLRALVGELLAKWPKQKIVEGFVPDSGGLGHRIYTATATDKEILDWLARAEEATK